MHNNQSTARHSKDVEKQDGAKQSQAIAPYMTTTWGTMSVRAKSSLIMSMACCTLSLLGSHCVGVLKRIDKEEGGGGGGEEETVLPSKGMQ